MAVQDLQLQKINQKIEKLEDILTHSGVLRGTAESSIAEAQGGELIGSNGRVWVHVENMEKAGNGLNNAVDDIGEVIRDLQRRDPRAANQLGEGLRPIRMLARLRADVLLKTRDLCKELKRDHPNRLAGTPFASAGRGAGALVSNQLGSMRGAMAGRSLLPPEIAARDQVQQLVKRIKALPDDIPKARDEFKAAAMGVRTAIRASLTSAGSPLLQYFAGAGEALVVLGERVELIPVVIVPKQGQGG